MKKFISPLLLILGISLILIPKLNDLYINNNSKKPWIILIIKSKTQNFKIKILIILIT